MLVEQFVKESAKGGKKAKTANKQQSLEIIVNNKRKVCFLIWFEIFCLIIQIRFAN